MNSIQSSKHLAFAGLSSHTCRYCQKIMFTSAEPLDEQTFLFSYNEVLEAKSDGCDLFSTQFNALQSILDQYRMDRHNEELWTLQTRISLDGNTFHFIAYDWLEHGESLLDSDDSKELHAFTLDDSFAARYIQSRPLNPTPKSSDTMKLVCRWLDDCLSNHRACRAARKSLPSGDMPSRLIAVGLPGDINVRLEELSQTFQEDYMALSYCWGGDQEGVATTGVNLQERLRHITLASLSATIQDAVIVTREVGFKYLWVDALCIVQDNEEDSAMEFLKMPQIYARALLTISAAKAKKGDQGFLQHRDIMQSYGRLYELPFCSHNEVDGRASIILHEQSVQNDEEEPIDRRGWTMQERHLPIRSVRYGSRQVEWECQEAEYVDGGCQCRETNLDKSFFTSKPLDRVRKKTDFEFGNWIKLVEQYSNRSFSRLSDRLPGFAAIAENFAYIMQWKSSDYRAGLWETHFPMQLLWRRDDTGEQNYAGDTPQTISASWSWASLQWPTQFDYPWLVWGCDTLQVVGFDIKLKDPNMEYGDIEWAHLIVKGYVEKAQWTGHSFKSCDSDRVRGFTTELPIEAIWDSGQREVPKPVWCLEVNAKKENMKSYGIILVLDSVKSFRRVGYFEFDHRKILVERGQDSNQGESRAPSRDSMSWNWFWAGKRQTIYIV